MIYILDWICYRILTPEKVSLLYKHLQFLSTFQVVLALVGGMSGKG